MKKTFTVNGMACGHCAANVEKAICALNGVDSAKVSLEAKSVEVDYNEALVAAADMKAAVDAAGFDFVAE